MINRYELIMIAPGDYSEEISRDIYNGYKKTIRPAKMMKAEFWGNKKLAYPIGKQERGWYYLFDFYASEETFSKIEQYIGHDASIMKHVSVLKEKDGEEDLSEFESDDYEEELEEESSIPSPRSSKCEQDLYPNVKPQPVDVFDLIFGLA